MEKVNFIKKWILTLGFVIGSAGMFVSCVEEEVTPVFEESQIIDEVIETEVLDSGDGNDGNDNADGPRGNDHDIIDIDIL